MIQRHSHNPNTKIIVAFFVSSELASLLRSLTGRQ